MDFATANAGLRRVALPGLPNRAFGSLPRGADATGRHCPFQVRLGSFASALH
jgi:hypothetical protein